MTVGLIVDATMAVLLVATISFCIVLYQRLQKFRAASLEIKGAIAGFSSATLRAEASTAGLRKAADGIGEHLQTQVEAGRALADELRFLLESGATAPPGGYPTADASIAARGSAIAASTDDSEVSPPLAARSEAERELLEIMRQAR